MASFQWIFSWGREDEDKKRQENGQTCLLIYIYFYKIFIFGHIYINQHNHFLVHCHSSWSTFGLHLVKGPKTL